MEPRRTIGYRVTDTEDRNITPKMGLAKCLNFAHDNDETQWHHVERIKSSNRTQLLVTVQVKRDYVRIWYSRKFLTRHETRAIRSFAKEKNLRILNPKED